MKHEYAGMTFESKPSDGGCVGCYFDKNDGCNTTPGCAFMIWIKKEDSVKATEEITFTPEQTSPSENITFSSSQIKYLSEVFGIDASEEVLKVSDGFIRMSSQVWWKGANGPKNVKAIDHWDNIKDNPEAYSVKEPKYKVVYE